VLIELRQLAKGRIADGTVVGLAADGDPAEHRQKDPNQKQP
jgi:hypothetical protein